MCHGTLAAGSRMLLASQPGSVTTLVCACECSPRPSSVWEVGAHLVPVVRLQGRVAGLGEQRQVGLELLNHVFGLKLAAGQPQGRMPTHSISTMSQLKGAVVPRR